MQPVKSSCCWFVRVSSEPVKVFERVVLERAGVVEEVFVARAGNAAVEGELHRLLRNGIGRADGRRGVGGLAHVAGRHVPESATGAPPSGVATGGSVPPSSPGPALPDPPELPPQAAANKRTNANRRMGNSSRETSARARLLATAPQAGGTGGERRVDLAGQPELDGKDDQVGGRMQDNGRPDRSRQVDEPAVQRADRHEERQERHGHENSGRLLEANWSQF
jgi:hypothetical protein